MKIVRVAIEGDLTPGDVLLVHTMAPRGGRTTGGAVVEKDRADIVGDEVVRIKDTIERVVSRMVESCAAAFLKESYRISAKTERLIMEEF